MHPIQDNGERGSVVEQLLEMFYRLLFSEVQTELPKQLLVDVALFDVWDIRVRHERDQVQDQVRAFPQDREGGEAVLFEARVVHRLDTAHGVDHLLADLDGRSEWFGVTSEDVAKIHWG